MMSRRESILIILILLGASILLYGGDAPLTMASLLLGLLLVFLSSEPVVEGFRGMSLHTGLSEYLTGVISSLASNLPEAVLAVFMALSPHLREVAVLTVMLASAFNGLLLGLLIIMLTMRGGSIEIPRREMEHEVEIMRITVAFTLLIFGAGVIINLFHGQPKLPREIPPLLLLAYISYLYFIGRGAGRGKTGRVEGGWMRMLIIGLIGILLSAELISGSLELLVERFRVHVVVAATLIGFAGSVPEHGLALLGARRGHVELAVSNLLSGIVQSIMLVFPLLSLLIPIELDGYVLYQFLAISTTLWIVKKAIVDDGRFTLDEGVSILLAHLLGVVLFDELSRLI